MSQTKYKLPPDVRILVVSLVKGYGRRVRLYDERRSDILEASPCQYDTYLEGKEERRAFKGHGENKISKPTEGKYAQLESLERHPDTLNMRAVEQAYNTIAADIGNDELQAKIKEAIWESTISARECPYEAWELPTICRNEFYERKRKFLYGIAKILDLV